MFYDSNPGQHSYFRQPLNSCAGYSEAEHVLKFEHVLTWYLEQA